MALLHRRAATLGMQIDGWVIDEETKQILRDATGCTLEELDEILELYFTVEVTDE